MSPAGSTDRAPLLAVRGLGRAFDVSPPWLDRLLEGRPRRILRAVDGIDLTLEPGRTLALVGESGCGKSTVARCIVGLLPPSAGSVRFKGVEVGEIAAGHHPDLRRRLQMIFQDPYSSLNPRWRVRDILADPLRAFRLEPDERAVRRRVAVLLREVGLAPEDGEKYPHEFSGGQRQRIAIARAIASEPDLIVCDEPTSALDVSIQAQILGLLQDLGEARGLAYLLISHNLAVVDHMADEVGVMYLGRLVERRLSRALFAAPAHPYTRLLIETVPSLSTLGQARAPLAGEVPSPLDPPRGCAFHPRCPLANARCRAERPALRPVAGGEVACHAIEEGRVR